MAIVEVDWMVASMVELLVITKVESMAYAVVVQKDEWTVATKAQ